MGFGPEVGRCLSKRAGSGTIPTRHRIFIPAAEDAGLRGWCLLSFGSRVQTHKQGLFQITLIVCSQYTIQIEIHLCLHVCAYKYLTGGNVLFINMFTKSSDIKVCLNNVNSLSTV